jgi:hypothetical protein
MDLKVIESAGNGGDLVKTLKDVQVIEGFESMPYLAMFGGNVEASTQRTRLPSEQLFDFWGNNLLFPNDQSIQFNSETERTLNTTALTSSGRSIIEAAVKRDLAFMKAFCEVAVAVSIIDSNRVVIGVRLQEPNNQQSREFIYIWDATRNELNLPYVPSGARPAPLEVGFDYNLDFTFI